jgi:biopolymer transport protein ExbB
MLAIALTLVCAFCGQLSRAFAQSENPTSAPALADPALAAVAGQPAPAPMPAASTGDEASSPATTFKGADSGVIPTRNLFSIVREGGLAMLPLLVCSFVMLVFVFERTISLRRGRVVPGPFVTRFLQQLKEGQLDREGAVKVCQENGSPVARVFAAAAKKWGRPAVEMEQAIIDTGERVVHELRRYLRVFNSIATIGPMLGLLGTVGGMIRAFNNIASSDAMGRPELLAKGISEALLTTATGLAVAVPAIVLYWWFVSMVDRLTVRIDSLGQDVVGLISAEAIQEAAAAKPTRTPRKTAA